MIGPVPGVLDEGELAVVQRAFGVGEAQVPTEDKWDAALRHQCILQVTAREAADVVCAAWRDGLS